MLPQPLFMWPLFSFTLWHVPQLRGMTGFLINTPYWGDVIILCSIPVYTAVPRLFHTMEKHRPYGENPFEALQ